MPFVKEGSDIEKYSNRWGKMTIMGCILIGVVAGF